MRLDYAGVSSMTRRTLILGAALAVAGCTSDSDKAASTGGSGSPATNGGMPGATADASAAPMGSNGENAQAADDPQAGNMSTPGTPPESSEMPTVEASLLECAPVCGDNVLECEETEDDCPTTQSAGLDIPSWDCTGSAPSNVYAYAHFADGGERLQDGACLMFFEGAEGLFYAQWSGYGPADGLTGCDTWQGCVCPGSPSYDRRLYAFTSTADSCQGPTLVDRGNNTGMGEATEQAVSNDCRKYLFALHGDGDPTDAFENFDGTIQDMFELSYTYVGSLDEVFTRLTQFPKAEVTCIPTEVAGFPQLAQEDLLKEDILFNAGYTPK